MVPIGQRHASPMRRRRAGLTVMREDKVHNLRLESVHIIRSTEINWGMHVVSRQVLIVYVINMLIILFVLGVQSSEQLENTSNLCLEHVPFKPSPALLQIVNRGYCNDEIACNVAR